MDPRLEPILHRTPDWLAADGPDADVVVSSRVRIARNLARCSFPRLLGAERARELCGEVDGFLAGTFGNGLALDPAELEGPEAEFLIERSLATRDLFESAIPTRVLFLGDGSLGLMVNEEDHFRIQGFAAGLDLRAASRLAGKLAEELARRFRLARHDRYGYLTACPTNVGSGMRASLMLHLPAHARAREPMSQALQTARRSNLAVRGVHGEGSRALGNLYQISNQVTLGVSTREQIAAIESFGRLLVEQERRIRSSLMRDEASKAALVADAKEAWATLSQAAAISSADALNSLSCLRLALLAGIDRELGVPVLPKPSQLLTLCFQLQPGHLQARFGTSLDPARRDRSRSLLLRDGLGLGASPTEGGKDDDAPA